VGGGVVCVAGGGVAGVPAGAGVPTGVEGFAGAPGDAGVPGVPCVRGCGVIRIGWPFGPVPAPG